MRSHVGAVAVLCAAMSCLSPQGSHASTPYIDPTFNVDVRHDIVYSTAINVVGDPVTLTLDLYTPRGDTSSARPVFVFAHGGFFTFGDKSEGSGWGNRLAQRGYVVASINYRLSPALVVAPVDTQVEIDEIDDARADMQTAVRWFRANAASLKIDPDRIAVGGSSAGAVTALGVAVNNDDPAVSEYPGLSSAVCTAVSYSGANDPLLVDPGDTGAIFHHGVLDTIVPFEMAVQTRDAMLASGLDVQWFEYAGEGHGLSADAQTIANTRTIQWLHDRVAVAPYPCSPAVAHRPRVLAGSQTPIAGLADRSAVVSLVAVQSDAPGYVQALPCGGPVGGYMNGAAFDDADDARILDTRLTGRPAAATQTMISGRPNATAVVSLVATDAAAPGFVQALACGATPGSSSNLNVDAAGETIAGLAFIHFDATGHVCLFDQQATDLVADVQGYLADGAFDDVADVRLTDTRER